MKYLSTALLFLPTNQSPIKSQNMIAKLTLNLQYSIPSLLPKHSTA
uniref:Uncharacterized protein n=1 Tax=Arundo donax TaxID=35708 RepID=A0A0A9GZ44_ARUDO